MKIGTCNLFGGGATMDTEIDQTRDRSILVIDDKKLRCAALVILLESWAKPKGIKVSSREGANRLYEDWNSYSDIVILSLGAAGVTSPAGQAAIHQIRRVAPHASLVIISDDDSVSEVAFACKAGSRGFIHTGTNSEFVFQALDFILSGGSFFPSAALAQFYEPQSEKDSSTDRAIAGNFAKERSDNLTVRQREVLIYLREGKSNKLIARELNMQEATVKVHVRQIMRKLGAANRTQAALRAMELPDTSFDVKHEIGYAVHT
jgi:DNA-binding NarL/FixJ family response regulator